MNILSVNKYYWRKGGSESVFFNEKHMLESAGHSVIPFSMKGAQSEQTPYSKYFVNEVDYSKPGLTNRLLSASKIIYSFEAANKMRRLLSEHSPDIAHFHIFQHQISPSVFGPLMKNNVPIILTLHDLKPICPIYTMYRDGHVCEDCKGRKFYNCLRNRCTKGSALGSMVNTVEMYCHYAMGYYQKVDRYIAVSKFYRNKMIEYGFSKNQISYLPNYVEAEKYNPNVTDKGYVLYFGRLSEEKGLSMLLDAAEINDKLPFYIVGTGPLYAELMKRTQEEELNNVQFFGFQTGSNLWTLIAEATCVVVPSAWYENCPMNILESFAAGKLVIGTDIGGIPELIEERVDGFTVSPATALELADRIDWVFRNRSKAREMGMEGRRKVEEHFNAEKHYDGLISIYNSVLGN